MYGRDPLNPGSKGAARLYRAQWMARGLMVICAIVVGVVLITRSYAAGDVQSDRGDTPEDVSDLIAPQFLGGDAMTAPTPEVRKMPTDRLPVRRAGQKADI